MEKKYKFGKFIKSYFTKKVRTLKIFKIMFFNKSEITRKVLVLLKNIIFSVLFRIQKSANFENF